MNSVGQNGAPTLFLMIEVAQRELDSRLLLARAALERGYRVVIGQQWLLNAYLPRCNPGVVLYKGINNVQGGWMLRARLPLARTAEGPAVANRAPLERRPGQVKGKIKTGRRLAAGRLGGSLFSINLRTV